MRMVDLIQKKRRGEAHTKEEIQDIIRGFTKGRSRITRCPPG